jgi:hypothetical protein
VRPGLNIMILKTFSGWHYNLSAARLQPSMDSYKKPQKTKLPIMTTCWRLQSGKWKLVINKYFQPENVFKIIKQIECCL